MHLSTVQIEVGDLAAAAGFFADVLELPVETDHVHAQAKVTVGRSTVILGQRTVSAPTGVHHLAFNVAAPAFSRHRDWLAERVGLLAAADGRTEFEGPHGWNSRSIYFPGPDQMVLELIGRRNLASTAAEDGTRLLCVSEVGVAVADVPAAVDQLRELGWPVFGDMSAEFAPVGDDHGLLIVVADGRAWLPVFDVVARPLPTRITVAGEGVRPGAARLNSAAVVVAPYG